jgi:predicted DNA-binding protein (MmcQ/YjbR family)
MIDISEVLTSKDDVSVRELNKKIIVYSRADADFLLAYKDSRPQKLSLRCDSKLGKSLVEQYESVMRPNNLDPRQWITVLITDQIGEDFTIDLLRHAYELAKPEVD